MLRSARDVSDMLALWSLCLSGRVVRPGRVASRGDLLARMPDLVPGPAAAFVFVVRLGKGGAELR